MEGPGVGGGDSPHPQQSRACQVHPKPEGGQGLEDHNQDHQGGSAREWLGAEAGRAGVGGCESNGPGVGRRVLPLGPSSCLARALPGASPPATGQCGWRRWRCRDAPQAARPQLPG